MSKEVDEVTVMSRIKALMSVLTAEQQKLVAEWVTKKYALTKSDI